MIDVYEQIRPLLTFECPDDFYFLQILQRKKENPEIGSNSRVVKNYYVGSIDYLDVRYDEIKAICNQFNARAMLRLNKRSYEKVAFKTMQNIANSMANREYSFIRKSYDRACGDGHNDPNKKWIIDIDDPVFDPELYYFIEKCNPVGKEKIICTLPTKNGVHIITNPFDLREFSIAYRDIDVHKDNPINLYIP